MAESKGTRAILIDGHGYYTISENGEVNNIKTGKIIKATKDGRGYLRLRVRGKARLIHRLIMEHFVPNPNNYPCVNHIDGNKQNNSLDNLEWCTYSHNIKHAFDIGLKTITEKQREAGRIFGAQNGIKNKGGGKIIFNTVTGVYYTGVKEALYSLSNNWAYSTLAKKLNGSVINGTNLKYV